MRPQKRGVTSSRQWLCSKKRGVASPRQWLCSRKCGVASSRQWLSGRDRASGPDFPISNFEFSIFNPPAGAALMKIENWRMEIGEWTAPAGADSGNGEEPEEMHPEATRRIESTQGTNRVIGRPSRTNRPRMVRLSRPLTHCQRETNRLA